MLPLASVSVSRLSSAITVSIEFAPMASHGSRTSTRITSERGLEWSALTWVRVIGPRADALAVRDTKEERVRGKAVLGNVLVMDGARP